MKNYYHLDVRNWDRSSYDNWASPTENSLKMLVNLYHDYIVSDIGYSNYTLSADITTLAGDDDGVGVIIDFIDEQNYKYVMYQGGGLNVGVYKDRPPIVLVEVENGVHTRLESSSVVDYWEINSTFNIKLENTYGFIRVYINDEITISYDRESYEDTKIGFVTYSQIADFNNIEIYETLANKMTAKYKLYAVKNEDIPIEIIAKQYGNNDIPVEIHARAYREHNIDTEIEVKYRGNSDIPIEIFPKIFNEISTEIEVPPHNRMWALYEVQQPPLAESIYYPIKDSFVRSESEFSTINYGSNLSMVAGRQYGNVWYSFVEFDVSSFDLTNIIKEIKLRLYYSGVIPDGVKVSLYRVEGEWNEYGITYLNMPDSSELLTDEFIINTNYRYVEFDVTNIVNNWVNNSVENYGFAVKLSDDSYDSQVVFKSRESYNPPQLVIYHYDSRVFSFGKSFVTTQFEVKYRGNEDVLSQIEVGSAFNNNDVETIIRVHRVGEPMPEDIDSEIIASKNKVSTEITIPYLDQSEVFAEIEVYVNKISNINTDIVVSKLYVPTEVTVIRSEDSETELDITISKKYISTEITPRVTDNNDISTELYAVYRGSSEILSEITALGISHDEKHTELIVSRESIYTEIIARVLKHSSVYTFIASSKPSIDSEIYVKYYEEIETEIDVIFSSKVDTEITVNKPFMPIDITVRAIRDNDVSTEVFVSYTDSINVDIVVNEWSQIETEIDVKAVSQIKTVITSTKPFVNAEIIVPYYDYSEIETEVRPRILMVSNIDTVIIVGAKKGAYAFII